MPLKIGARGFILLGENFDQPRWREAQVVGLQKEWVQVVIRASVTEVESHSLSSCKSGDYTFCLVECKVTQLRMAAPGDSLDLEVAAKKLGTEGATLLGSEGELSFATASEPDAKPDVLKAQKGFQQRLDEESGSSSQSSSATGSEVLDKLQKKWLGGGTAGEEPSGKSRKSRSHKNKKDKKFSLLAKSHRPRSADKDLTAKEIMQMAGKSSDPMQGLLALHLAQSLTKKGKKSRRHRRSTSSASSGSGSSRATSSSRTSSQSSEKQKGHAKAVEHYQQSRRRMFRHPLRHVRRYVKGIERELGAEEKGFKVTDYTRRIPFGKQKNLQRCHHLLGVILEYLLKEEYSKAALRTVLCLQAIHQCALDGGWEVAWLLTHTQDPFERRLWGGDPANLQSVTAYLKSMNELAKTTDALKKKGSGRGDEVDSEKPQKTGKGKDGKGRKKEEPSEQ